MFCHTKRLQFEAKPERPDALYARKVQEFFGGAYGEMTVTMQYLFEGWNCRVEGKYKDLIMDTATEEIGHVEMPATMVARLLEGAPATMTAEAAKDPVMAAVLGGMDPQQAIVAGGVRDTVHQKQWLKAVRTIRRSGSPDGARRVLLRRRTVMSELFELVSRGPLSHRRQP